MTTNNLCINSLLLVVKLLVPDPCYEEATVLRATKTLPPTQTKVVHLELIDVTMHVVHVVYVLREKHE